MIQYFPKPYEPFGGHINVKIGLANYTAKADLKDVTGIDTSNFALKSKLASLKTELDKLDIGNHIWHRFNCSTRSFLCC